MCSTDPITAVMIITVYSLYCVFLMTHIQCIQFTVSLLYWTNCSLFNILCLFCTDPIQSVSLIIILCNFLLCLCCTDSITAVSLITVHSLYYVCVVLTQLLCIRLTLSVLYWPNYIWNYNYSVFTSLYLCCTNQFTGVSTIHCIHFTVTLLYLHNYSVLTLLCLCCTD